MSDIFISYSRKDSELALRLASFLTECGHSVWIDQSDIHAATMWSSEIVRAITGCRAFILLLSENSINSKNVVRELALASEKGKHILPIKLEHVVIPEAMEYQLAGIQRLPFGEDEALLLSLARLGLESSGRARHRVMDIGKIKIPKRNPRRRLALAGVVLLIALVGVSYFMVRNTNHSPASAGAIASPAIPVSSFSQTASLMILPFEDLSRNHNLGYFVNESLSELIYCFSSFEGIRIIDQSTSYSYRNSPQRISQIANELNVRYFVEGNILPSGHTLRIRFQLFDFEKGHSLLNGEFEEATDQVFEIPGSVAKDVLSKCGVTVSNEDLYRIASRHTPQFGQHPSYDR